MLSLQADKLRTLSIPVSTSWLLSECMEAKGKQELWTRQRPEVLTGRVGEIAVSATFAQRA
jgi:hypothetical protein